MPKAAVEYPSDLPIAHRLQCELLERIALAVERIADAAEVTASPVPTEIENVVESEAKSLMAQASHKHGRRGGPSA